MLVSKDSTFVEVENMLLMWNSSDCREQASAGEVLLCTRLMKGR